MNKVILRGHLGGDPEVRRMQDGRPVVNFLMATSDRWTDKATGEKRERSEWHRVVIFAEGLAKVAEQYLKKGMNILVEGELRTRKWTHQDGSERYSTEVVLQGYGSSLEMLGSPGGNRPPPATSADDYGTRTDAPSGTASRSPAAGGKRADLDDEIPF